MMDTRRPRRTTYPRDSRLLHINSNMSLMNLFLKEHEDSLSRDGAGLSQSATASETAETEELDENLLDDDDEDEEDAERRWKRNTREDEK